MTGPLTAAESFLTLLDDLQGSKPNGATAAVLLAHAATHIRDLLEQVRMLSAVDDSIVDDPELDTVLDRVRDNVRAHVAAKHANPDLSHLPPMAGDGEPVCDAYSRPDPDAGTLWPCNARRGHPERWHAAHDQHGVPFAGRHPGAAWPVTGRETGLPRWAAGWSANPRGSCLATLGRWTCNAVPGHEPADHVAFAPWESPMAGAVLARWPSARPVTALCGELSPGGEMECRLGAGHLSRDHIAFDDADQVTGSWPVSPSDVRRDGMGAQGEPATGTVPPGTNTVPPHTGPGHIARGEREPFRLVAVPGDPEEAAP